MEHTRRGPKRIDLHCSHKHRDRFSPGNSCTRTERAVSVSTSNLCISNEADSRLVPPPLHVGPGFPGVHHRCIGHNLARSRTHIEARYPEVPRCLPKNTAVPQRSPRRICLLHQRNRCRHMRRRHRRPDHPKNRADPEFVNCLLPDHVRFTITVTVHIVSAGCHHIKLSPPVRVLSSLPSAVRGAHRNHSGMVRWIPDHLNRFVPDRRNQNNPSRERRGDLNIYSSYTTLRPRTANAVNTQREVDDVCPVPDCVGDSVCKPRSRAHT